MGENSRWAAGSFAYTNKDFIPMGVLRQADYVVFCQQDGNNFLTYIKNRVGYISDEELTWTVLSSKLVK
jgi:hypothetical protein